MTATSAPAPSFLLAGVDGTFNYGGEAIIRGTVRILRERWPACRITCASADPAADTQRLKDVPGLRLVPSRRRWTAKRVLLGVARRVGIGTGSRLPLRMDLMTGSDVMLSVGGDNYGFMNDRGEMHPLSLDLADLAERSLRRGKKVVLWGASVGPFDADPRTRERFARHLRRLSLITAREADTVAYLAQLGCAGNVATVADPAFLMQGEAGIVPFRRSGAGLIVGVNFSPASLAHVFGAGKPFAERRRMMISCLRGLLHDERVRVLLVPHVLDEGAVLNDDHRFLAGLLAEAGGEQERMRLLPRGLGAARTKGALAGCDVVVASRLHCCVAAISSGVPTLLLAYSMKAHGLARYTYGHERWCLHVSDLTPAVFHERIAALIRERNDVADFLLRRRLLWEADARRGGEALEEMLS